jgi:hypothetical protein
VTTTRKIDGVHLDADPHMLLGAALAARRGLVEHVRCRDKSIVFAPLVFPDQLP